MSYQAILIGGGWQPRASPAVYGPLLAAASAHATAGPPTIGCVVIDKGDGPAQYVRWAAALNRTGPCVPRPVLVPVGAVLDPDTLLGCHGVLVCGGLTPAYAAALTPVGAQLRELLAGNNIPYAGFSAGAVIAARQALVGGWLDGRVPVCPEDAAEDLSELTVVDGLALVPIAIDVHAASWGTLPRLIAAVRSGLVGSGVAIDEDTALVTAVDGSAHICGSGRVHWVRSSGDLRDGTSVLVTSLEAGPAPRNLLTS